MCESPRPRHCACCLPCTISQTPRFSDVVVGIANTGCYSHDALPSAMRTGYIKTAPSLCIFQILTLMRVSGTGKQVNRGRRKVEHRAAVEDYGSFGASIAISSIQRHNHVASIELTPANSRTYVRPSSGLVHQPLTPLSPQFPHTMEVDPPLAPQQKQQPFAILRIKRKRNEEPLDALGESQPPSRITK